MGLGEQRALLVDDGHRLAREAGLAQGELEANPDRHLALRVGSEDLVLLVDRRHRREPHDPRPFARRDLDRQRVEPADAAVERDGAEHGDPRDGLGHHLGALGGRGVVRLQPEAGLAGLQAPPRELDVGDPPRDEVRRDVHVVVDAAADELPRALGGDRMLGVGGHRPSLVHRSDCRQSHRKSCGERSVRLAHEPQGAGHRRPFGRLRVARRRRRRQGRRERRHGRGHRAVLRRARRVGRAVEAGGPDRRQRQAHPPRARPRPPPARWARASAAWTSATTRCRSTPTRSTRSPTPSAPSRPTCSSPTPIATRSTPTTRLPSPRSIVPAAWPPAPGCRAASPPSRRRRSSSSSPTSPSCATSRRRPSSTSPR